MEKPANCIIVIFGASGDLTSRKLIPALFELKLQELLPEKFFIVGVSRSEFTHEAFCDKIIKGIRSFSGEKEIPAEQLQSFKEQISYLSMDMTSPDKYKPLEKLLADTDQKFNTGGNYMFYLATPPVMFETLSENLGRAGLTNQGNGYRRLIFEKPFGHDLESAKKLNQNLLKVLTEDQIYRIDHYLGKETVQNLLVTRFANGIFEPLWNRNYIHHIEITSAESIGVENRGKYYDSTGALRDMVQNHLLSLVSLTAMEPPSSMDSNWIRNEKTKVLQSLRPIKIEDVENFVIRGQYVASNVRGQQITGFREEHDVNADSHTETYVAIKFYIDNWRWGGVPFYIRTGKRLPTSVTEIVIHFNPTPHYLFSREEMSAGSNQLVIRIQPDEGILLKFGMKLPGEGFTVKNVNMDFHYKDLANIHVPSAYERLLHDAMLGDSTLYSRGDTVEAAWSFIEPIQHAWAENPSIKIFGYPAGNWGPEHADDLIEGKNYTWRYPCKNLTDEDLYCEL
jgi:glucose-6-phosphate 1-dehydrogenase